MIPMKNIVDGVTLFATNDVIPKMPNGLGKFLAYAAVGAMRNQNPDNVIGPYRDMLTAVGILEGDMVNEIALKDALKEAFSNVPTVSFGGFTFDSADKEKLLTRIGI